MKITIHIDERGTGKTTRSIEELLLDEKNCLVVANEQLKRRILCKYPNVMVITPTNKKHGLHIKKLIIDEWFLVNILQDEFLQYYSPMADEIVWYGTVDSKLLFNFMFHKERITFLEELKDQLNQLWLKQFDLDTERKELHDKFLQLI
jgi:CRISPR/Cas system CSM-associated protein Csm5 (group 7 of RAMP superfamily)